MLKHVGRTPGASTFTLSIIYNAFGRTWGTPLQYHVVFVPFGVGSSTADKSIRVLKRISNLSFLKLILIIAYNFKIILYHAKQIANAVRNIFIVMQVCLCIVYKCRQKLKSLFILVSSFWFISHKL